VTDNGGLTASASHTVQVSQPAPVNQPPTAAISGPATGQVGETLNFSGSGSGDADGHIVSYAWDFGDSAQASGAGVSHAYAAAGSYQVTLTVTDNGGLTASASHTVQVSQPAPVNQPPTAAISGPATGQVGQAVTFDGSGSSDPEGASLTHAWDFGDGDTGSGQTVTHTYQQTATYTVTLTVTDDGGLTGTATHSISVAAASGD
jgi:PKD repeat protein